MAYHSKFHINVSRRGVLRALGMGGLAQTVSHLGMMNAAANEITLSDYRALVCIFLRGGCDMNNFLIPRDTNPQAEGYTVDRGVVAIPNGSPSATGDDTIPLSGPAEPFGFHPSLANMAAMFNGSELGVVANCGTLAEPVTPGTYNASILPVQLFSHSDQVVQWMAGSEPEKPFSSGWGGRIADNFAKGTLWNQQGQTSMLITVAGNSSFLASPGGSVPQYAVTETGPVSLIGYGSNYSGALDANGKYLPNDNQAARLAAFEDIMRHKHQHILEEGYNTVVRSARENEGVVGDAIDTADNLPGVDFDAIFANAASDIGNELKMVAKLIAGRKCLGNNRQIFFVDQSGYDTHQDINADQPVLLTDLDNAIGAFNTAMHALDGIDDFHYNDVIGFQASDFNRTWTPNGNNPASSGTDHAWGTHAFIFGGPVNGGQIFGTFPSLVVAGPDDVPQGDRGRWIPTTAVDQYSAVLAKWIGVSETDIDTMFPSIGDGTFTNPLDPMSGTNLDLVDFNA